MTEHAFDPNWPHGHLYVCGDGRLLPAKIVAQMVAVSYPLVAVISGGEGQFVTEFDLGGYSTPRRDTLRLVNAPAPEVVEVGRDIFRWHFVDRRDVRKRAEIPLQFTIVHMSDGTFRATAEVVT